MYNHYNIKKMGLVSSLSVLLFHLIIVIIILDTARDQDWAWESFACRFYKR